MTTIVVPDPALVLLVGAAGAGKTTFAGRHFAADEVLSSDAYRAVVSGDEANQAASAVAFRILHRELERRLAAGQLSVVDATNVAPHNRRQLIARAGAVGTPVVAIVLALAESVVLARNAGRHRRVDEDVIRAQLARVDDAIADGALAREGCGAVWILRTPDAIDHVTVRRLPVTSARALSPNRPLPPQ